MALQNVYPQKQASYLKDTTDFIKLSKAHIVCETCVANILMARIEQAILKQNKEKPLVGKRFIDDIFLYMGHKKEESQWESQCLPPYNQVYWWSIRNRNYILGHIGVQGRTIRERKNPRWAYVFEAYWEISVHTLQQLSPREGGGGGSYDVLYGEAPLESWGVSFSGFRYIKGWRFH